MQTGICEISPIYRQDLDRRSFRFTTFSIEMESSSVLFRDPRHSGRDPRTSQAPPPTAWGIYFFLPPPQGLTNSISPVRELTCLFLICLSCFLLMVFILCVFDICERNHGRYRPGRGTCWVRLPASKTASKRATVLSVGGGRTRHCSQSWSGAEENQSSPVLVRRVCWGWQLEKEETPTAV